MTALELKTYEIFKSKLGEEEAKTVLQFVEEKTAEKIAQQKDIWATKQDLGKLETGYRQEDKRMESGLRKDLFSVETNLRTEINKLDVKITDTKAELIRWMFIFWIGQLAAIIAIVKLFFAN
jgi:hypothetical protein